MCVSPSGVVSAAAVRLVALRGMSLVKQHVPALLVCGLFFIGLSVLYFRIEVARAAGSQPTCSHTVRPLPARGLATASDRVSLFQGHHASSVCVRERWRGWPNRPRELVENIISTVPPSGDTSLAVIAQPLDPLVGYTINLCQHTNTIQTHPKNARYAQDNAHSLLSHPLMMMIISPMAQRHCHCHRRHVPLPASHLSSRECRDPVLGPTWLELSRRRPAGGWHPPFSECGAH